jgi:hypothetical protein
MRTIETQVNVTSDRRLDIQLPEDIETGQYQVVIVINPQTTTNTTPSKHQLNQLAGKIEAFKDVDAVTWQQETRGEESEDFLAIAGIWENRNITAETLYKEAWKK